MRNILLNHENRLGVNQEIDAVKESTQDVEELKLQTEKNRTMVICNDVGFHKEKPAQTYKNLKQYRKDKKAAEERIQELRGEIDLYPVSTSWTN